MDSGILLSAEVLRNLSVIMKHGTLVNVHTVELTVSICHIAAQSPVG